MIASTLRKAFSGPLRNQFKNYEWNHRAIIATNYRTFVETRKTPLRREDFLKENEEMARELDKEKKTPAGWDKSHREEAERFNRGDGDGKRPPQDLSRDYSKAGKEFKATGPRNMPESPATKEGYGQTTARPSKSDSAKDWAKVAGKEESDSEVPHHSTKPAEEFQKSVEDVKEGAEEMLEGAKKTIKKAAEKLTK